MGDFERDLLNSLEDGDFDEDSDDDFDDDDSFADPDFVDVSEHDSDSEQEIVEDDDEMQGDGAVFEERTQFFYGKDGTRWRKDCRAPNVRTIRHNIVIHLPGVKQYARGVQSPMESWLKLIDENMLNSIVTDTNIFIRNLTQNEEPNYRRKETSLVELKALIGLLYIAGVKQGNRMSISEFWATGGNGLPIEGSCFQQSFATRNSCKCKKICWIVAG